MKKGVILSVDKHFLTLLTPEGEFHRSKKEEEVYEIGKEIYFSPYDVKRSKSSLRFYTRSALISAMVSILLILSFLPSYFNEKVFAYVTIDINPSIELSLNENLRVVDLYGINKEGLIVIEKIKDWEDTDVTLITDRIVKATKDSGYAENEQQILVTATLLEDNKVLTKKLDKKLEKISKQKVVPEADVKIMKATVKERSKAKEQGISTGTYIENKRKKEQKKEKDIEVEKSTPSSLNKTPKPTENRAAVERRKAKPSSETKSKTKSADMVPSSTTPTKTKSADIVPSSTTPSKAKSAKSQTPAKKTKKTKVVEVKKAVPVKRKGNGEIKKQQQAVIQHKNKNQQPKVSQQINNQKTKENNRSSQSNQKIKEIPNKFQKEEKQKHQTNKNQPINHKKQTDLTPDKPRKEDHNRNERGNEKREYHTPHEHF
ncbi:anti-sigma factor domain-containing protein [Peribacillus psychrosaccharolyticus]|uniref:Anti-sigma factor domain-containing protein n=2 Tax=Peribacillus psychrosaccharolyticus TaxID=1407 RepID=A0A974NQ97_PERPY|nr:anti-sigma factor domain-containing protein [Peribacillus psychrosaccharolyticus]MEC2057538.1 anti-sigma factor domain-containing protein [Peribacillus psychrosaccharolyticus]QQT01748.1 anti-sigma factor domain-containing protein [Peribacillus psychrosaccharolyticus]